MPRGDSWDETKAMQIVGHFLGAQCARVDPGGGPTQLHDFDACTPDGSLIAVEVTRHNDPLAVEARSAINASSWAFGEFTHTWLVDVIDRINVRHFRQVVPGALAAIERAGVPSLQLRADVFGEFDWMDRTHRAARALLDEHGLLDPAHQLYRAGARLVHDLGVTASSGNVIVGSASSAGSYAPESMVRAVERHALLNDNAAKLAAASDRTERHLFVWVETSQFSAYAALCELRDPDVRLSLRPPTLPDFVDAAWVATATEPSQVGQYHRAVGWQHLGPSA